MATRLEQKLAKQLETTLENIQSTEEKIDSLLEKAQGRRTDLVKKARQELDIEEKLRDELNKKQDTIDQIKEDFSTTTDKARELGQNIEGFVRGIPGGDFLAKSFGLTKFGEKLENDVIDNISKATLGVKGMGSAMKFAFGFVGIAVAGLVAAVTLIRRFRRAARDLAQELGTSAEFAKEQLVSLKAQELSLKVQNFESDNLKNTFKDIVTEFGSLENATAANAANLEMLAQKTGTAASDIVKFNKVMMDLTGASFDVSTNMAEAAINTAKAANVSTGKVMSDIAESAALFAEFSRDGADGLAQAAVAAAKVGSNLSVVLGIADKLLDFESSLTAEFEAQVLTGKQLNLERARQLSLEGDIEGLTREVQQTIGSLGEIQRLNVIERRSIANAIGVSVDELLKISRGEKIQERETVQQKLDITNKLLSTSNDDAKAYYENDLKKKGETGIGFGL